MNNGENENNTIIDSVEYAIWEPSGYCSTHFTVYLWNLVRAILDVFKDLIYRCNKTPAEAVFLRLVPMCSLAELTSGFCTNFEPITHSSLRAYARITSGFQARRSV